MGHIWAPIWDPYGQCNRVPYGWNDKSQPLINICDTFNLDNIVKQPTCFMKNQTPSLIDVILTNSKTLLCNTANFNCGLSDCHHMIATSLKEICSYVNNKNVTFRSYKNFSDAEFNQELSQVPFHVAHIFDDIDDIYWAHETLLREVLDEQAPLKQKKPKVKSTPIYEITVQENHIQNKRS